MTAWPSITGQDPLVQYPENQDTKTTYADDHAFSFIKHKTFGMQLLGHIAATASHIFNYKKMKQKKRQKGRRPPI